MKNIAIVYGELVCGGVEKVLLTMLKMLDYSKYNITLFLENNNGELQHMIDPRVKVRVWEKKDNIVYSAYIKTLFKRRKLGSCVLSVWYRVLAHIFIHDLQRNERYSYKSQTVDIKTKEHYDAVIAYQALSYWHLLYARNHIESKKYICWIHGIMGYLEDEDKERLPKLFKWFNQFICVSNSVKESFLSYSPKLKNKIRVIYNLIDIEVIKKAANKPIEERINGLSFATVGRVSPEKGQMMIPRVAKELRNLGYIFTWFIVGDGSDMEKLRKEIKELSLQNNLVLTGMKENPYPYMKQCNLYIQTSYTEGFCLTAFEAKALGKHIVVTDLPVMRELYTKGEAVFCEPTVPSLVKGIQQAISEIDAPVKYSNETAEFNKTQLKKIDELLSL